MLAAIALAAVSMSFRVHPADQPAPNTELIHRLGERPATPEELAGVPVARLTRAIVPHKVDLSSSFPRPGDQKDLNSCTAWAVGYYARSYYAHAAEGLDLSDVSALPSPTFIYDAESAYRASLEGPKTGAVDTPGPEAPASSCDNGGSILFAAGVLIKYGSPNLADYPLSQHECKVPDDVIRGAAGRFTIKDGEILRSGNNLKAGTRTPLDPYEVKAHLAAGDPVIIGTDIGHDFMRFKGAGVYTGPPGDRAGGHAMTIVGYDDDRRAYRVINSWGPEWGDNGFAWVSYDFFARYVHNAIVLVPNKPVKPPTTFVNLEKLGCGGLSGKEPLTRPKSQCDVLEALSGPLGESDQPKVTIKGGDKLKSGDQLAIEIETPGFPSYLHAFYLQADRTVVHLVQSEPTELKQYPPHTRLVFGDGTPDHGSFKIGPPFGDELIIAIASRSPLFDRPRPQGEADTAVVDALKNALAAQGPKQGGTRDLSAWFASLTTKP